MVGVSLTLMLLVLWALTHHFQGFARDGELYAVQALARLHPALRVDVYLANNSQDQFSIFSRIYAWFIGFIGLQNAALLLFVSCTAWFLSAAWALAREVSNTDTAWLAVIMLLVTTGSYGASAVFHYSESYLTARSLAEALIVTALAAHLHGSKRLAIGIAVAALSIHPLMALPGLLLLICLWLPIRQAVTAALAGVLFTLSIALAAVFIPQTAHFLTVMDAPWLEVVRERSQFVFLKYWSLNDWEMHARPFLCLAFSAWVFDDDRVRRLCIGAMLVGAAALAVAFIAGAIGPVAILLQGQAWRWFWVTGFVSVLMLAPTAVRAWRDGTCGPFCAALIIAGWTFAAVHGAVMVALALLLWGLRSRIEIRRGALLRWAAYTLIAVMAAWVLANSWSLITSPRAVSSSEPLWVDRVRSILGMQVSTIFLFAFFWYWVRSSRALWRPALAVVLLSVSVPLFLPGAFTWSATTGSDAEIAEFADWRNAVAETGNVLIIPARKSAAFVWLTLERPSYLSVNQSAGVIFSRPTALEIRRRSAVLLPVTDPDWKILSQLTQETGGKKLENLPRPLTSQNLAAICVDPVLSFVIAKENVGFDPIRHTQGHLWKDWHLYDCRRVRSAAPPAPAASASPAA